MRRKFIYFIETLSIAGKVSNWYDVFLLFIYPGKERILLLKSGIKFKLNHHLDAHVIKEVFYDKDYGLNLSNPKIILDVGAHIGTFSIYSALKFPNSKIYSFEPRSDTFKRLNFNIRSNSFTNIKAYRLGLAAKSGERLLYKPNLTGLSNLYIRKNSNEGVGRERIEVITLTKALKSVGAKRCDLLKLDCEGAEYEILLNTPEEIFKRIDNLVIEYHDNISGHTHEELTKWLKKIGYKIRTVANQFDQSIGFIYATR